MTVPLGTGALCLSVLAGSTVTSLNGKNGLLCGLLFGGIAGSFVGLFRHARPTVVFTFTAIKAGSILLCGWGGYAGILWREAIKSKLNSQLLGFACLFHKAQTPHSGVQIFFLISEFGFM